jgi:hypothetical protein
MTAQHCTAPGCGRFVRAGATLCRKHDTSVTGDTPPDDRTERRLAFLERLERGEYAALFDENLSRVIEQAARKMQEHGPGDEIGALRFVLARLLAEEQDAAKLAASVTRVASAAVQAARAQRTISGESADGLTSALTQILVELDEG